MLLLQEATGLCLGPANLHSVLDEALVRLLDKAARDILRAGHCLVVFSVDPPIFTVHQPSVSDPIVLDLGKTAEGPVQSCSSPRRRHRSKH